MATCPNCGEIVMEGDPYCSNCGCTFSWIDDEEAKLLKEKGAKLVSLGKRILRTETAPVAIASIIMYEIGE